MGNALVGGERERTQRIRVMVGIVNIVRIRDREHDYVVACDMALEYVRAQRAPLFVSGQSERIMKRVLNQPILRYLSDGD